MAGSPTFETWRDHEAFTRSVPPVPDMPGSLDPFRTAYAAESVPRLQNNLPVQNTNPFSQFNADALKYSAERRTGSTLPYRQDEPPLEWYEAIEPAHRPENMQSMSAHMNANQSDARQSQWQRAPTFQGGQRMGYSPGYGLAMPAMPSHVDPVPPSRPAIVQRPPSPTLFSAVSSAPSTQVSRAPSSSGASRSVLYNKLKAEANHQVSSIPRSEPLRHDPNHSDSRSTWSDSSWTLVESERRSAHRSPFAIKLQSINSAYDPHSSEPSAFTPSTFTASSACHQDTEASAQYSYTPQPLYQPPHPSIYSPTPSQYADQGIMYSDVPIRQPHQYMEHSTAYDQARRPISRGAPSTYSENYQPREGTHSTLYSRLKSSRPSEYTIPVQQSRTHEWLDTTQQPSKPDPGVDNAYNVTDELRPRRASPEPPTANLQGVSELNTLILGETGVGKSTFINAFANYLAYGTFTRQSLDGEEYISRHVSVKLNSGKHTDPESLKHEKDGSGGQSATQETKTYEMKVGETIVRLLDTPGIGDTRGSAQDKANMDDILIKLRTLFALELTGPNLKSVAIQLEGISDSTKTGKSAVNKGKKESGSKFLASFGNRPIPSSTALRRMSSVKSLRRSFSFARPQAGQRGFAIPAGSGGPSFQQMLIPTTSKTKAGFGKLVKRFVGSK